MLQTKSVTLAEVARQHQEAFDALDAFSEATDGIPDEVMASLGDVLNKLVAKMAAIPVASAADALAVIDYHRHCWPEHAWTWGEDEIVEEEYGTAMKHSKRMMASLRQWLASQAEEERS